MSNKELSNNFSLTEGTWYDPEERSPEAERLIGEIYKKDDFEKIRTLQETADISIIRKIFPGASLARCINIKNRFIGGIYNFKIFPDACLDNDEVMREFFRDFVESDAANIITKLNIAFSPQRVEERDDIISLSKKLYVVDEDLKVGIPIGVFILLCAEEKPKEKIISELSGIPKDLIKDAFERLKRVSAKCLAEEKEAKKKKK